jgi:hypothetical protein
MDGLKPVPFKAERHSTFSAVKLCPDTRPIYETRSRVVSESYWHKSGDAKKQILRSPPPNLPQRAIALWGPRRRSWPRSLRMTPPTFVVNFGDRTPRGCRKNSEELARSYRRKSGSQEKADSSLTTPERCPQEPSLFGDPERRSGPRSLRMTPPTEVRDVSRKEQPQILRLRLAEKPPKLRSG